MRGFSSSTVVEKPTALNRRQPIRQTRTNPVRTASNVAQTQGGALPQPPEDQRIENPGFFPAITHFTDSITALPKEMTRHYTMLKEVDAKIYGPEAQLGQLLNEALRAPPPPRNHHPTANSKEALNPTSVAPSNSSTSAVEAAEGSHPVVASTQGEADASDWPRRNRFHMIRQIMNGMLTTLDEKNHVLNTAIDGLAKQLKRCNSSYPHIEDEISEEARLGSMTHWAYTDKTAEKKGMIGAERTRRAANNAAAAQHAIQEAEGAAVRSTQRREAVADRKKNHQYVDSDFDDTRVNKRGQAGIKGRKVTDGVVGLGIKDGGAQPPTKRRKIEKLPASGLPQGKAMASVYSDGIGTGRGGAGSSRDLSINDGGKKKARGGAAAVNGSGRRRVNTNASAANSPSLASSPIVSTFAAAKDRQGRSPAPTLMQRIPSSRARQNSTQSVQQLARNRSSSTNHKNVNGNGLYGTTADIEKVSGLTGKSTGEVKHSMRETVNSRGEHLIEAIGADGAVELRGGLVVGSKNTDRALKREESVNGHGKTRPPSISISTRGGNSKGPSKTATPINGSFAEPTQPRPRRELPTKRSHKKGAGLAAQLAAATIVPEDEGSSLQGDEDDEEGDEHELRYCYCNEVSYGEMVGCDGKQCQREWFHLQCVGLARAPAKNAKWYCDECKENLKDSKFSGGNGR
ncbi:hypothetical protein P7C71_g1993, partial [Lecanoromycetidae sp. Uapishka_2]